MVTRNNPVVAIVTGNSLEAAGLRELTQKIRSKAYVRIFSHIEDYLSETEEEADILYIEEGMLAIYGERLRSRRIQVVPVVSSFDPGVSPYDQDAESLRFICTRWKEDAIRKVIADTFDLNKEQREKEAEKGLSNREIDVLKEVARGLTNKEIADKLSISMNTVMTHRKNITAKLNIKTVSGLTFYALMNNLITGEEMENKARNNSDSE